MKHSAVYLSILKNGVVKHPNEREIILTDVNECLGLHIKAIMPTDVRKPKKKASAEGAVGNIATDIIAKLRNITFHDFPALKEAVTKELKTYNFKPFEKHPYSTKSLPKSRSLPAIPYETAT